MSAGSDGSAAYEWGGVVSVPLLRTSSGDFLERSGDGGRVSSSMRGRGAGWQNHKKC